MVNIQLAGIPIQLNNKFPELEILCRGYETTEKTVITLSVSQEEIEEERSLQADIFTDGYLETVCLYRKLALQMLQYDIFIMHASVIEVDGEGYAFLASSGTGKTTQTRLWMEYFGNRARVINGDKPLIRLVFDGNTRKFLAYGTPWCGKEGMSCNASVPLKALFLLERAAEPSCELASEEYSIDRLFRQMLMPEQADQMEKLLSMADQLIDAIPCYILRCNMAHESVEVAFHEVRNR